MACHLHRFDWPEFVAQRGIFIAEGQALADEVRHPIDDGKRQPGGRTREPSGYIDEIAAADGTDENGSELGVDHGCACQRWIVLAV